MDRQADWWRGAVIYQIYPRSFQDSNGDGVGDLAGITTRLEYIAGLGADAIWISPFFTSPMADFGYDVADYRDVDPLFGTLADFDALLVRAHELGLRVMIDLVLSHTSDQHPWFKESRQDTDNQRTNWYVWADPKADGTPPNNWLSVFGGPAWEWEPRRGQYYLHNFLASQPDLNFHELAVQEALLDVARFWMARGIDGFRLDTINFYFHDKALRDNPVLPPNERNASIAPLVNPYNDQRHIYSKNQPENLEFLHKFRSELDRFGAIALGEVGDAQHGLEILGEYTAGDARVHMCYAFEFLGETPLIAGRVAQVIKHFQRAAPDGWAAWAFSNHDVMRMKTRWGLSEAQSKLYATLLMCLPGAVCLYQGQELGLPEAEIPRDALQDPYGKRFWPVFKGRDGCRTPMVWEDGLGAGFSKAKPWLPIPEAHRNLNVARQTDKKDSLMQHYKNVITIRRQNPALQCGAITGLETDGNLLYFRRNLENKEVFCAFNLGDTPIVITKPVGEWHPLLQGAPASGQPLGPWQAMVLARQRKGA